MESCKTSKNKKKNIILGISGSVASIKLKELASLLSQRLSVNICIVPTQNSLHFVSDFKDFNRQLPELNDRLSFLKRTSESRNDSTEDNVIFSFTDADEWSSWSQRLDPVLHIEIKKWADALLIAPLDANTMAKIANGLCDNLLTCVVRAWDIDKIKIKPIVICPAMNTFMYKHPITNKQLSFLIDDFGFTKVDCVEKMLICGDVGLGAMASVDTIVDVIETLFNL